MACEQGDVLFFPVCFLISSCARTRVFFFVFFPALPFLNLRLFVDRRDREKKVRDSCVGTAAGGKVQLGIFAWSETDWRSVTERRKEKRRRQRGRGGGQRRKEV